MHWSRWGDPAEAGPLAQGAFDLVEAFIGTTDTPAVEPADVRLSTPLADDLLTELAGIVGEENVLTDHDTRLHRTRGKSTPDLLKLRGGDGSDSPDAVVRPATHEEVAALIAWAVERHVALVPFGGGTSVVGGLVARRDGYAGVVSLDLIRLDKLLAIDPDSMTATLEPGLRGPQAEALLAEHGLTLGHFPQSFEYASIGGFAVTRSSGQSSAGYGRFDALVVGLRVATPQGELVLGSSPANAAGPDLREVVMGSEGAFGVVTSVTVRVRRVPEVKLYETWRWDSFADGAAAMRTLAQSGVLPTVLRLSDEAETSINLARPAEVGGESTGAMAGGCLMVTGYEGTQEAVDAKRVACTALLAGLDGTSLGEDAGWSTGRFHGPYLRDSLLDVGVLVETLETVTFWSRLHQVYDAVKAALTDSLGEGTLVLCHISHVYETGASLYFTVATKQSADPIAQWLSAKAAASDAMIDNGASITHHHAVGQDHKPWLAREIGPVGVGMLRALKADLDPTGVLNPGVLIP
jgi:alkyldihydroxyacetonephosphate synthase